MAARRILYGFVILAMILAITVAIGRNGVESSNTRVSLTYSWHDVLSLSQSTGRPVSSTLRQLKRAGVTDVSVPMMTLSTLIQAGTVNLYTGTEIQSSVSLNPNGNPVFTALVGAGKINPTNTYIMLPSGSIESTVRAAIKAEFGKAGKTQLVANTSNGVLISSALSAGSLAGTPFGLNQAAELAIRHAGLGMVPRMLNPTTPTQQNVQALLNQVRGLHATAVIFAGSDALGYPRHLTLTAKALSAMHVPIGSIEFTPQKGIGTLGTLDGYDIVRVFSLSGAYVASKGVAYSVSATDAGVRERGIRLVYLHEVPIGAYPADTLRQNLDYVHKVALTLEADGFILGHPTPMTAFSVPRWELVVLGLGTAAAGLILFELFWPGMAENRYLWWMLAGAIALAIWPGLHLDRARRIMALVSALIFPTWSLIRLLRLRWMERISLGQVWRYFLETSALTLAGALIASAMLSTNAYFLELRVFLGVKVLFVLPPLALAAYFIKQEYGANFGAAVRKLWHEPLRISYVVWALVVAFVLVVYVSRTGNNPVFAPSSLELAMRGELRHILSVRPRTKEFLIGHPAFFLALPLLMRGRRWWGMILLVAAAIGQVDMVDTFAHLHITFGISALRTLIGLLFGGLIGSVLYYLLQGYWSRPDRVSNKKV